MSPSPDPLRIYVIDFEGHRSYGIVEFGIVELDLENREIITCQTAICEPAARINRRDIAIHGIDESVTRGHSSFREWFSFFRDLRFKGCFAAHQAQVERGLLHGYWRYPPFSPDPLNSDANIADWGPWIDTCRLYRRYFPDLASHKLQSLIEQFDLQIQLDTAAIQYCPEVRRKYHCALYDALASAILLLELTGHLSCKTRAQLWRMLISESQNLKERRNLGQQELF